MLNSPESRVIMIKTDAVLAACGKKKRQFFSLWYLGNIMMENQQLYDEKSA